MQAAKDNLYHVLGAALCAYALLSLVLGASLVSVGVFLCGGLALMVSPHGSRSQQVAHVTLTAAAVLLLLFGAAQTFAA
jgi:uncharacterized RDD family membrane protein YckC